MGVRDVKSDDVIAPSVLVTGGAKRIGGAISRRFAAAGWHVVIHYHTSREQARTLAESLPSAETVCCDLANGEAAETMFEDLSHRLTDWRAFVASASIFDPDNAFQIQPEVATRAMQVNARTPALMAQLYLDKARHRSGRHAILITDQKLENPNPDFFSYTMSKHALASIVPMLAMSARQKADRVHALAPGAILASHDQTEQETEISHRMNLLRRKTSADEVAEAALFLASGALASGETLFVDSGQHLLRQERDVIYLAREQAMLATR